MGLFVGDAAGARLEFLCGKPRRSEVKDALEMLGGGWWRTAPGQVTDDGEMALCLMHALAGTQSFSIERVAEMYLQWHQSLPFDMGRTTRNGLSAAVGQPRGRVHLAMWQASARQNMGSEANGSLMRVAPLGAWGYRLSEEELVDAARMDRRLTRPARTAQPSTARRSAT
jgi:ADP-ribosyl-[dinitrogen reductase] hydrolase